jgi:glutathionylspermidine synthase
MYGKEYALATVHGITGRHREELAQATEQLGKVFAKTVTAVQTGDASLLVELGIPKAAIEAARVFYLPEIPTLVGRFDFVHTIRGWKMLEFNSDTPGGVVEAFYVNGKVCAYFGDTNPNTGLDQDITAAFRRAMDRYQYLGYKTDHVFFSALDWHEEDAGTARFLQQCSGLNAKFVALKDLRIYQDALYALSEGELLPVDVLYRLHPLGILAEEKDIDGYPTGAHLLDLVVRGKLAMINPPGALIAQSKAMQALIWNLHEQGVFFTAEEHQTIKTYMLPTYFENRFESLTPYVSKPVLGREGGAITLFGADGQVVERDQEGNYWDQDMVYQEYVKLETIAVETLEGTYNGHLMWGSFLIGGKASAIMARVGGRITSDLAYCLPLKLND